jgi:hypothetical protein
MAIKIIYTTDGSNPDPDSTPPHGTIIPREHGIAIIERPLAPAPIGIVAAYTFDEGNGTIVRTPSSQ